MSGVQGVHVGRHYDVGLETRREVLGSLFSQSSRSLDMPLGDVQPELTGQKVSERWWHQLVKQVEEANRYILNHHTHLEFSIHKETKAIIVRIIDSETQEVLKEIPPEKLLDLVAKLWEMAGLLIDEKR